MIKCVIFDLGGVYFTDGTSKAIKQIGATYGVPEEKVHDILKGDLGTEYRCGRVAADEFWNRAKEYWGISAPTEEVAPIWIHAYEPIEGTVKIVDRLNAAGYEVIFLSDNVQERIDYVEDKYHFMQKFKDGVFSHLVGTRKPDPKIYEMTLKKTSYPAEACVFIDDKSNMLEPAEKLGMKGIAFESPEQLEKDLKSLSLNF